MKVIRERKQLEIGEELIELCKEIQREELTEDEWSARESCDQFQSEKYCGGFDAVECEFTFSYYDSKKQEWWFQFSLHQLPLIISGSLQYLDLSHPYGENT